MEGDSSSKKADNDVDVELDTSYLPQNSPKEDLRKKLGKVRQSSFILAGTGNKEEYVVVDGNTAGLDSPKKVDSPSQSTPKRGMFSMFGLFGSSSKSNKLEKSEENKESITLSFPASPPSAPSSDPAPAPAAAPASASPSKEEAGGMREDTPKRPSLSLRRRSLQRVLAVKGEKGSEEGESARGEGDGAGEGEERGEDKEEAERETSGEVGSSPSTPTASTGGLRRKSMQRVLSKRGVAPPPTSPPTSSPTNAPSVVLKAVGLSLLEAEGLTREEAWEAKARREEGEEEVRGVRDALLSLGLPEEVLGEAEAEAWERKVEKEREEEDREEAKEGEVLLSLGLSPEELEGGEVWEGKVEKEREEEELFALRETLGLPEGEGEEGEEWEKKMLREREEEEREARERAAETERDEESEEERRGERSVLPPSSAYDYDVLAEGEGEVVVQTTGGRRLSLRKVTFGAPSPPLPPSLYSPYIERREEDDREEEGQENEAEGEGGEGGQWEGEQGGEEPGGEGEGEAEGEQWGEEREEVEEEEAELPPPPAPITSPAVYDYDVLSEADAEGVVTVQTTKGRRLSIRKVDPLAPPPPLPPDRPLSTPTYSPPASPSTLPPAPAPYVSPSSLPPSSAYDYDVLAEGEGEVVVQTTGGRRLSLRSVTPGAPPPPLPPMDSPSVEKRRGSSVADYDYDVVAEGEEGEVTVRTSRGRRLSLKAVTPGAPPPPLPPILE